MRIAVIIASSGRPNELAQWKKNLDRQSFPPHQVLYSLSKESDLSSPDDIYKGSSVIFGSAGLCAQRNRALELAIRESEVIAFFDDDYVPHSDCLKGLAEFMKVYDWVGGASGELYADGIITGGISYEAALDILANRQSVPKEEFTAKINKVGLYGCNMIFRSAAIGMVRFDEHLPLYSWQEDIDFSMQISRSQPIVFTNAFSGVHQGTNRGRTSGVKFGYSQIANPIYLVKKGTMVRSHAIKIMFKNLTANILLSFVPERWIDRKGRVKGNFLAIHDLIRSRLHPARICDL